MRHSITPQLQRWYIVEVGMQKLCYPIFDQEVVEHDDTEREICRVRYLERRYLEVRSMALGANMAYLTLYLSVGLLLLLYRNSKDEPITSRQCLTSLGQ